MSAADGPSARATIQHPGPRPVVADRTAPRRLAYKFAALTSAFGSSVHQQVSHMTLFDMGACAHLSVSIGLAGACCWTISQAR
jgi:hypothetical protein